MNKIILTLIGLSMSAQLFAGTVAPSESDVEKWAYHYHQHPDLNLVPDVVFYFSQRPEQPYDDHNFITGFMTGIFRSNPSRVTWLLQKLNDLHDKKFDSVIMALWLANLPESRTVPELIKSRRGSGLSINNLPDQPKTTREFIFTGVACGLHAATGERDIGPSCWRDLSGLQGISDFGYVQTHHIFATRNSPYVNELLSTPASDTGKYRFIYASLQLLHLDEERKQLALYAERIKLEKQLGLPRMPVKTVADALALVRQDPKLLDALEVKMFREITAVRFAAEHEISDHIRSHNESWKNEKQNQYQYRGNAIWSYGNAPSLIVVLAVRNTSAAAIPHFPGAQVLLEQGEGRKALSLSCSGRRGDWEAGTSILLECTDPGHNHANGRRSTVEELATAITYMKSMNLPLALEITPGRRDYFPDFDSSRAQIDAEALAEIKKTNCLQRGSCSEALARAVQLRR